MNGQDLLLKNFLVESGLVSRSQIEAALAQAEQKSFTQAIVEGGLLSEDEMRRVTARALGIPFVTLGRDDINLDSLVLISEPLSRTANMVAYAHGEEGIEVALLDIADLPQIDFLRQAYRVQVRLTDRQSIKQALMLYQKHLKETFVGLAQSSKEAAESLIRHALHSGAHYVHLEPAAAGATGMIVRYRIAGALREAMRLSEESSRYIVERLKSLAKLFPVSTTMQEGSFIFPHDTEAVGISLTTVPTADGEKITLRFSRSGSGVSGLSLQRLGLHGPVLERVHHVLHTKKGLVVVAGMSGSGKTTLLYSMLNHVANQHLSVATVEEKVEQRLPGIQQTATRPDLGLGIAAALRGVLKQDPDVVMISTLDKEDVAEVALRAAERGVFVLGGIAARSALGGFDELLFQNVDKRAAATHTTLVLAERLVRKVSPQAVARSLTRTEGELLEGKVRFAKVLAALKAEGVVHEHTAWKDVLFFGAKDESAYDGVIGIQEMFVPGLDVGADTLTMLEDALFKAVQGLTSIEQVVDLAGE